MPAYKDDTSNKWYCKFYYTDWRGNKKQKKKMGFKTKREAQEYERNFLNKEADINDMLFNTITDLYFEDMEKRLKETTIHTKRTIIKNHIMPYFDNKVISDIKASDVRKWQNELIEKNYKDNFLKTCQAQLSAIFNYAVKYYSLKENPCTRAGAIENKENKTTKNDMKIYTLEEYKQLIEGEKDNQYRVLFNILYWSGCRIGEALALTIGDINTQENTITINKTYTRLKGKDVITAPKTAKSNRILTIPQDLSKEIAEYITHIYDQEPTTRLITHCKRSIAYELKRLAKLADLHDIRIHDLRHSHASLLIDLGFSPLLISERLGHEKVETTLNTYSHLYPNKHSQVAEKLQKLFA